MVRATGADQTRAVGAALARHCRPGDVLLVAGGLGAGKTTFAQGFGTGLGVAEPVTSPTFALVREYRAGAGPVATFFHADVFRLDHLREIADLGLGELVEEGGVALVEWGDVAEPVLGPGALAVRLELAGEDRGCDEVRRITLGPPPKTWSDRWAGLADALAPWRWAG